MNARYTSPERIRTRPQAPHAEDARRRALDNGVTMFFVCALGSVLVHLAVAAPLGGQVGGGIDLYEPMRPPPDLEPVSIAVMLPKEEAPKPPEPPPEPVEVEDAHLPPPPEDVAIAEKTVEVPPPPKPQPKPRARRPPRPKPEQVAKPAPPKPAPAQRLGVPTDGPDAEGPMGDPANAGSGAVADAPPPAPPTGDPEGTAEPPPVPTIDLDTLLRRYLAQVARTLRRGLPYPRAAVRAELEGRCVVAVTIDASGRIVATELAESSGHSVLDDAAVAAARRIDRVPAAPAALQWRPRQVKIPFTFKLRS